MCFQPSPSSPIHKNPISRRAEVRALSLPLSLPFTFPLVLTHAHKQSPSSCVITILTITQTITQISGSPACVLSRRGRKTSGLKALKAGCLTRVPDTVMPRNNTRENSKTGENLLSFAAVTHEGVTQKSIDNVPVTVCIPASWLCASH